MNENLHQKCKDLIFVSFCIASHFLVFWGAIHVNHWWMDKPVIGIPEWCSAVIREALVYEFHVRPLYKHWHNELWSKIKIKKNSILNFLREMIYFCALLFNQEPLKYMDGWLIENFWKSELRKKYQNIILITFQWTS